MWHSRQNADIHVVVDLDGFKKLKILNALIAWGPNLPLDISIIKEIQHMPWTAVHLIVQEKGQEAILRLQCQCFPKPGVTQWQAQCNIIHGRLTYFTHSHEWMIMNYGINTFMEVVKEDISWVVLRKEDAEGYIETECRTGTAKILKYQTYNASPLWMKLVKASQKQHCLGTKLKNRDCFSYSWGF